MGTVGNLMRAGVGVLLLLSGLCTVFVLVATAAQAWAEHAEARWPVVTARVERCGLDQTSSGRRDKYYIDCRLSYAVGAEQNVATVFSVNVPGPQVWQYPANQIGPFEDWVDTHPQGTPIVVHYNPANPRKIALVETDMPRGGPRTPSNVKLLEVCGGIFLVLLAIARIARPWSLGHEQNS